MSRVRKHVEWDYLSVMLVTLILASFSLSLIYSAGSFTGYVVNETINGTGNLLAFVFFVVGLFLSSILIAERKVQVKRHEKLRTRKGTVRRRKQKSI